MVSYVCYGSHASLVGRVYIREAEAVQVDGDGCKVCCLSDAMFRKVCVLLLQDHYCIKIWRKNNVSNEKNTWVLESVLTPGDMSAAPYLCCGLDCVAVASLCVASRKDGQSIGIAFSTSPINVIQLDQHELADIQSRCMRNCFLSLLCSSPQGIYVCCFRLQSLLLQYGVRECMIFCSNADAYSEEGSMVCPVVLNLFQLAKELGIFCSLVDMTPLPSRHYIFGDIEETEAHIVLSQVCSSVENELRNESCDLSAELYSRPLGTAALVRLFQRLDMWARTDESRSTIGIKFPNLGGLMLCDSCTYDMLRVFDRSDRKGSVNSIWGSMEASYPQSLYSVLNSCRSHMGRKMLKMWLRQPSTDLTIISQRHDIVWLFSEDPMVRDRVQRVFDGLPDVDSIGNVFK